MGLKPFFFFLGQSSSHMLSHGLLHLTRELPFTQDPLASVSTDSWLRGAGEILLSGGSWGSHRPTQQLHCDLRVSCLATVITSSNCFLSCNIIITDLITYCIQFPGLGNLGQNLEFYLPLASFQFNSDLLPLKPYRHFNLLFH